MNRIGYAEAWRAIVEAYNISTEMIRDNEQDVSAVIDAMTAVGYRVNVSFVNCDIDIAMKRHRARNPNDVSSYFTQEYHKKWLVTAAGDFYDHQFRLKNGAG